MGNTLHRPKIAILASGSGSTAEAFIHATQDGRINAEVGLIISNNPPERAGVFDRVDRLNRRYGLDIETTTINGIQYPQGNVGRGQTLAESEAICNKLQQHGFDHVSLMGYMIIVRGATIEEYGWRPEHESIYQARMTNTHPGPLPETADTYGIHTSARVLELGMAASRHTVHLVSAGIDRGPVIAAHPVDVLETDSAQSLFERVQAVEKAALPYALDRFLREQREYYANS